MSDFSSDDEDLPVSAMIGESEVAAECCEQCGNSANLEEDTSDGKMYCSECWEQFEREQAAADGSDYEDHALQPAERCIHHLVKLLVRTVEHNTSNTAARDEAAAEWAERQLDNPLGERIFGAVEQEEIAPESNVIAHGPENGTASNFQCNFSAEHLPTPDAKNGSIAEEEERKSRNSNR